MLVGKKTKNRKKQTHHQPQESFFSKNPQWFLCAEVSSVYVLQQNKQKKELAWKKHKRGRGQHQRRDGSWRLEARCHDGQILEPYFTEVWRTLCDRRLVFEGKLCIWSEKQRCPAPPPTQFKLHMIGALALWQIHVLTQTPEKKGEKNSFLLTFFVYVQ